MFLRSICPFVRCSIRYTILRPLACVLSISCEHISLCIWFYFSLAPDPDSFFFLRQRTQAYECRGDTVFPFYYESLKREWLLEISTRMLIPAVSSRQRLLVCHYYYFYCLVIRYTALTPPAHPSMVVTSLICLQFPTFAVLCRAVPTQSNRMTGSVRDNSDICKKDIKAMRNNKTLCLKLVSLFCFRKEDKSFWKSFVTLRCATLCATAAAAAGISSWTGRSRDGWMDDTASQLLLVRYCSSILLSLVQLVVAATAATLSLGTFLIPQSSHYKHNINYQFQAGTLTAACSVTLLHWAPLFLNTPLFTSAMPCYYHLCSLHLLLYSASLFLAIFNWDYCSAPRSSFIQMKLAEPFKH